MKTPTHRKENELRKKGHRFIVGMDEVGKGALAGPIIAASVIFSPDTSIPGVRDSKLLSSQQREKLYIEIVKRAVQWSVGIIDNHLIDKVGIRAANHSAFVKCVLKMNVTPDYLLIDGLNIGHYPTPHEYIVKGDSKIFSIAAASIIAKVTRDRIMTHLDNQFPEYGFVNHKGYGTLEHIRAIQHHGKSSVHRLSFSAD